MFKKVVRTIAALVLSVGFISVSLSAVTAASKVDNGHVLGDTCDIHFQSAYVYLDANGSGVIGGLCAPSQNDPTKFIWLRDSNEKISMDYPGSPKIAFGRGAFPKGGSCPEKPMPSEDQKFVQDFPDTICLKDKGVWWSYAYAKKIVGADFSMIVDPISTETSTPVMLPMEDAETKTIGINLETGIIDSLPVKFVESAVLAIATYLAIATPAVLAAAVPPVGQAQPSPPMNPKDPAMPENRDPQKVPDEYELRSRKERRFGVIGGAGLLGHRLITLDAWRFFTRTLPAFIQRLAKFSSPAATIVGDGDYIRAVIGSLSFILYPVALVTGVTAFMEMKPNVGAYPLPSIHWLFAMVILGCFDALAGAICALAFTALVIATDPVGHVMDMPWEQHYSTLISLFILAAGPALFAGAMRRFDGVHTNRKGKWERLVDYALSPVVTSWVVWKVVEALPKIANSEPSKVLERYSRWIALAAGLSIILRYFLEGLVAKRWTGRINEIVAVSVAMDKWPRVLQYARKGAWTWLLASIFIGRNSFSTWLLVGLVVAPGLAMAAGIKQSDRFNKLNVAGTPRLGIMFVIGLVLTGMIGSSKDAHLNFGFLLVALLPVFYFSLMEALTKSHITATPFFYETVKGRWIYRTGSVALYVLILYTIAMSVFKK